MSYLSFLFNWVLGSYDFKAKQHFDKGFRQGVTQGSVLQQGGENSI